LAPDEGWTTSCKGKTLINSLYLAMLQKFYDHALKICRLLL